VAAFVAGSSQIENYLGLPYRRMLFELKTGHLAGERASQGVVGTPSADDEPYLVARMLPLLFRASLEPGGLHGKQLPQALETATFSSIDSDALISALLPALREVGRGLAATAGLHPEALAAGPAYLGGSRELGVVLRALDRAALADPAAPGLHESIARALGALDGAVVSYALGRAYLSGAQDTRQSLQGFRGVSVWMPADAKDFASRLPDFRPSRFYRELGADWEGWLARYIER
jgi:hypothetical protein